jgi:hypothetical protein
MDITTILFRRYPGTSWTQNGDEYSGLDWQDSSPKPTEKQLEASWPEVQYEIAYEAVEKTRAEAYRQISDPIFFQYQRGTKTEQDWLDAVQAIKDANPYPNSI